MIVQRHHCQKRNFNKQSIQSWQKRKMKNETPNLTANNVTTYNFCQYPVKINTPRERTDIENERRISSDSITEKLKEYNILTLQSTINDYADDHSNKNITESDPKSDPFVDTHTSDEKSGKITDTDTTKGNYPHKLLTNRAISSIIQGVILSFNQTIMDGIATSGRALYAVRAVLQREIVTVQLAALRVFLKMIWWFFPALDKKNYLVAIKITR